MDVAEYEQVAEFKGMVSTKHLGRFIKDVARYYNEGFVVIECNSIGEAVFNEVYYNDTDSYINIYKQKKVKNNVTRMTGWTTDTKSRKLITNELIDWFTVDKLWEEFKIYSNRIYMEMATWVWDGNKPVHDSSAHDDSLIALSLAIYLRNKATSSGQSFFIKEDGRLIDNDSKDNNTGMKEENKFDVIFSEDEDGADEDSYLQRQHGVNKEQYEWLIGTKK